MIYGEIGGVENEKQCSCEKRMNERVILPQTSRSTTRIDSFPQSKGF